MAARLQLIVTDTQYAATDLALLPDSASHSAAPLESSNSKGLSALRRLAFLPAFLQRKTETLLTDEKQIPSPVWLGNPEHGRRIVSREFVMEGCSVTFERGLTWRSTTPGLEWRQALHGFEWLGDVRSYNDTALAAHRMREYILDWIECTGSHPPLAWHPEVMGRRVTAWLQHASFLLEGETERFAAHFQQSLARQTLRLLRVARRRKDSAGFEALRGLFFAACCIPSASSLLPEIEEYVNGAVKKRILPDGGHISRSPAFQYEMLNILCDIRGLLEKQGRSDAVLNRAVRQAAHMLRIFRMSDGKLALFHGTNEIMPERVLLLLGRAGIDEEEPALDAPSTGFEKLSAMQTQILMDTGFSETAHSRCHLSPLAVEITSGTDRIIVNCGSYRGSDERWRPACRSTPAHSTLHLEGVDAWGVYDSPAELLTPATPIVKQSRFVQEEMQGIEATHNGFVDRSGLLYRRRIALSPDGCRISAEEFLAPEPGYRFVPGQAVRLRFHLHPSVKIIRVEEGTIRLLTQSGARWKFKSSFSRLTVVEDSIYLGKDGSPEETSQILVTGEVSKPEWAMQWSLVKL